MTSSRSRRSATWSVSSSLYKGESRDPTYITGDTVWYDGAAEVARRFPAGVVVLFAVATSIEPAR
jgi:hypothetical protein